MALSRRTLLLAAAAAVLAAATGCGPSSAQLKEAREARYHGTRDEVMLEVMNTLDQQKLKPERSDAEVGALITTGRWYEVDGTYEDKALGVDRDDVVNVKDRSVFLRYHVEVRGEAPPFQVVVSPEVDQFRNGYSALYHMKPDDPEMPGWVQGKVDDLQLLLHTRLKAKFAGAPGTLAPAPGAS